MKIGIMQPYFFPYLGYFSLIRASDFWVVFDDVQFIRHGWIERNRVLDSADGWQYIKVPLQKASRGTKIKDTLIRYEERWQERLLEQLTCYKNRAPYYTQVVKLLRENLFHDWKDITSLNVQMLKAVCAYLDMPFTYSIYSSSGIDLKEQPIKAGEWALHIAMHYGAQEYVNPYGGMDMFDVELYRRHHVDIKFLKNNMVPYDQRNKKFEPGLSILDVMMYNSAENTRFLIDQYQFINS